MHLHEEYDQWRENSLINMKTAADWRPVFVGLGIIVAILGAVFLKFYMDQKKLEGFD
jgi:hypothetical protein